MESALPPSAGAGWPATLPKIGGLLWLGHAHVSGMFLRRQLLLVLFRLGTPSNVCVVGVLAASCHAVHREFCCAVRCTGTVIPYEFLTPIAAAAAAALLYRSGAFLVSRDTTTQTQQNCMGFDGVGSHAADAGAAAINSASQLPPAPMSDACCPVGHFNPHAFGFVSLW